MHIFSKLLKYWAYISICIVLGIIAFLFVYIFMEGAETINLEFLTQSPKGAILGTEGGIFPAIIGSLFFTGTAVVLGSIPAVSTAVFLTFYCHNKKLERIIRLVVQCISGLPSIVLGLFSYSFLVKNLAFGRCVFSAGAALGIMIIPFIEVRAEKSFRELPVQMINASYYLGCSKAYTIFRIVIPACLGELISGIILGGCYAMGATAPLMFTGAVAYASVPHSLFEPAMALPLHLYLLVAQGNTSLDLAYGTALVMMFIILISNLLVTIYTQRRYRKWQSLK